MGHPPIPVDGGESIAEEEQTMIVSSRSHPELLRHVNYDSKTGIVTCTCPAFRYRGYCSHIRFFKDTFGTMEEHGAKD